MLNGVSKIPATLILYESPNRINHLIMDVKATLGNRQAVLAREMTKRHEEFLRGTLADIAEQLEERTRIKGECTLLVAGFSDSVRELTDDIRQEIRSRLSGSGEGLSGLARDISANTGMSRNRIYKEALAIRQEMQKGG